MRSPHVRPCHLPLLVLAAVSTATIGCGSAPNTPAPPSAAAVGGPAAPSRSPAPAGRPIGEAQALHVVSVEVSTSVPTSEGVMSPGASDSLRVGVGQRVQIDIEARVPPWPAEVGTRHLLSPISIDPAVPAGATQPHRDHFILSFTAERSGVTAITYLPATCSLGPGVC